MKYLVIALIALCSVLFAQIASILRDGALGFDVISAEAIPARAILLESEVRSTGASAEILMGYRILNRTSEAIELRVPQKSCGCISLLLDGKFVDGPCEWILPGNGSSELGMKTARPSAGESKEAALVLEASLLSDPAKKVVTRKVLKGRSAVYRNLEAFPSVLHLSSLEDGGDSNRGVTVNVAELIEDGDVKIDVELFGPIRNAYAVEISTIEAADNTDGPVRRRKYHVALRRLSAVSSSSADMEDEPSILTISSSFARDPGVPLRKLEIPVYGLGLVHYRSHSAK
ncbi:hypothetical protein [Lacipirellula sp.]|uniref:hypothetical protein n=1 Tax=Lacipirellula sp. TaxID=2691419 RepID=UPI003D0CD962